MSNGKQSLWTFWATVLGAIVGGLGAAGATYITAAKQYDMAVLSYERNESSEIKDRIKAAKKLGIDIDARLNKMGHFIYIIGEVENIIKEAKQQGKVNDQSILELKARSDFQPIYEQIIGPLLRQQSEGSQEIKLRAGLVTRYYCRSYEICFSGAAPRDYGAVIEKLPVHTVYHVHQFYSMINSIQQTFKETIKREILSAKYDINEIFAACDINSSKCEEVINNFALYQSIIAAIYFREQIFKFVIAGYTAKIALNEQLLEDMAIYNNRQSTKPDMAFKPSDFKACEEGKINANKTRESLDNKLQDLEKKFISVKQKYMEMLQRVMGNLPISVDNIKMQGLQAVHNKGEGLQTGQQMITP